MLRLLILLISVLLAHCFYAQDVWLQNHFSPSSGCGLSNSETVNVLINNNSGVVMPSNSINVTYTVDGASMTSQLLSSNLFPGASWSFTFSTSANLSACGPHTMKVWVTRAGDANHLNDTLVWIVNSDCPVVPGSVGVNATVCEGVNSGTLNLTGYTNGTIAMWESSSNGGTSWSPISNATASNNYTNLTDTTIYRVILDGGTCPDDTSSTATITTVPPPVTGTIAGADSLCENAASGTLTLSGNNGSVVRWESSEDDGSTWTTIVNPTTTNNYSGLMESTIYRALVDGGVCADEYSDTALIYVDPVFPPTVLAGSDSLCITNASGIVSATGAFNSVLAWEYSENGGSTWNSVSNTTGIQVYSDLTQTTYYRMITDGGFCPDVISDTAIIYVQAIYPTPDLGVSDTLCSTSVNGSLNITGNMSDVIHWERSEDNGSNWDDIANTTTTFDYSSQTDNTWYRVLLDGEYCPDYYSDTAYIQIDEAPLLGVLDQNSTVCQYDTIGLHLLAADADSLFWEYSLNGVTWNVLPETDTVDYTTPPVTSEIQYRVTALRGVCPPETSNSVLIMMNPLPVVTVNADTTIYLGDTVQLNGMGGFTGIWMPGATLSDSTIVNPIAIPVDTGIIQYAYYVIDTNGCVNSASFLVDVLDPIQFIIRNVVTMNDDDYNDTWNITGIGYFPNTSVKVFNQYGKMLFESDDYKNEWEGTYDGDKLPNGTYYYVVVKGGTTQEFKGTITLLGND